MIEINKIKTGKANTVEILESRVALEGNIIEINITHKGIGGTRLYPNPFYIRKTNVVKYPVSNTAKRAFIVPVCDMSSSPTMNTKYVEYDWECFKCKTLMRQTIFQLTVSYVCDTCGAKGSIQWIVEENFVTNSNEGKTTVTEPKQSGNWGEWRSAATKTIQVEEKSAILPSIERKSQGEQTKFM
jgi:hypothetical protein